MENEVLRDDYDSPWKEALDEYFKDFLDLLFPMAHDGIDWSVPPKSLDKELQKVTATAALTRQVADKLKEVQTLQGDKTWVLIHIEVQSQWEAGFPERILRFDTRLFDEFGKRVVSLIVLGDDNPDWHPQGFGWSLWGYELKLRFPTVKLARLHVEGLEQSQNRFAPVVLAHLKTMETKKEPESRREWKFRIVRSLYEQGHTAEDVRKLFRLIDWLMRLPMELETQFQRDLEDYEEKHHMPYVTAIERMAEARGKAEGETRGKAEGRIQSKIETLLLTLETRFGEMAPETVAIISTLQDEAILTSLQKKAILAATIGEFTAFLEDQNE